MAKKLTLAQKLRRKADLIAGYKASAAEYPGTDFVSNAMRKRFLGLAEYEQTRMDALLAESRAGRTEQPK